jgi:hypothetical protein
MTLTFTLTNSDTPTAAQQLKQRVPNTPRPANIRVSGLTSGAAVLQVSATEAGTYVNKLGADAIDGNGERTVSLTPGHWLKMAGSSLGGTVILEVDQ